MQKENKGAKIPLLVRKEIGIMVGENLVKETKSDKDRRERRMLLMTILTWEPEKRDDVIKRRAEWEYPQGMRLIGEWSDLAGGRVFSLVEVDDPNVILAAASDWEDLTKLEVTPVMETEEVKKLWAKR